MLPACRSARAHRSALSPSPQLDAANIMLQTDETAEALLEIVETEITRLNALLRLLRGPA